MVKLGDSKEFRPWLCPEGIHHAIGYSHKNAARKMLRDAQKLFGKENAYVQQYEPWS